MFIWVKNECCFALHFSASVLTTSQTKKEASSLGEQQWRHPEYLSALLLLGENNIWTRAAILYWGKLGLCAMLWRSKTRLAVAL